MGLATVATLAAVGPCGLSATQGHTEAALGPVCLGARECGETARLIIPLAPRVTTRTGLF